MITTTEVKEERNLTESEKRILNKKSKQVLKLLFPQGLTNFQENELLDYIQATYKSLHCCVLYEIDTEFKGLLTSLGIDPDLLKKQEVIITQNFTIRYTDDYVRDPHEIRC